MPHNNHRKKLDKQAFGKNIMAFGSIFAGIVKKDTKHPLPLRVEYPRIHPVKGYKSRYHRK